VIGDQRVSPRSRARSRPLDTPVMIVAVTCATAIPVSFFVEPVRTTFAPPLLWVTAAFAAVLLVRYAFDGRVQRGVWALNVEMNGGTTPSVFVWKRRRIRLFDPQWGVFGARTGPLPLTIVRTVLLVESFVMAAGASFLPRGSARLDIFLAFAAFALTTIASLVPAALDAEANDSNLR